MQPEEFSPYQPSKENYFVDDNKSNKQESENVKNTSVKKFSAFDISTFCGLHALEPKPEEIPADEITTYWWINPPDKEAYNENINQSTNPSSTFQVYLLQIEDNKYCLLHGYGTLLRKMGPKEGSVNEQSNDVSANTNNNETKKYLLVDEHVFILKQGTPSGNICKLVGKLKNQQNNYSQELKRIYPLFSELALLNVAMTQLKLDSVRKKPDSVRKKPKKKDSQETSEKKYKNYDKNLISYYEEYFLNGKAASDKTIQIHLRAFEACFFKKETFQNVLFDIQKIEAKMGRAIISWKNLDSISTIVEGQNDAVAEQILIAIRDGCEKLLNTSEIPKRKIKEIVKNAIEIQREQVASNDNIIVSEAMSSDEQEQEKIQNPRRAHSEGSAKNSSKKPSKSKTSQRETSTRNTNKRNNTNARIANDIGEVDAFEEENSNMLDDSNITNQHNENSGHGIIDTLNRNTCDVDENDEEENDNKSMLNNMNKGIKYYNNKDGELVTNITNPGATDELKNKLKDDTLIQKISDSLSRNTFTFLFVCKDEHDKVHSSVCNPEKFSPKTKLFEIKGSIEKSPYWNAGRFLNLITMGRGEDLTTGIYGFTSPSTVHNRNCKKSQKQEEKSEEERADKEEYYDNAHQQKDSAPTKSTNTRRTKERENDGSDDEEHEEENEVNDDRQGKSGEANEEEDVNEKNGAYQGEEEDNEDNDNDEGNEQKENEDEDNENNEGSENSDENCEGSEDSNENNEDNNEGSENNGENNNEECGKSDKEERSDGMDAQEEHEPKASQEDLINEGVVEREEEEEVEEQEGQVEEENKNYYTSDVPKTPLVNIPSSEERDNDEESRLEILPAKATPKEIPRSNRKLTDICKMLGILPQTDLNRKDSEETRQSQTRPLQKGLKRQRDEDTSQAYSTAKRRKLIITE